jgi:hypothetical protein
MPGLIPHLITGCVLFVIGRLCFRTYFHDDKKHEKVLLLAVICLIFSILPDFFLGIYYITHLEPFKVLLRYQVFTHHILTPIVIGVLFLLAFLFDTKRRPLWLMGVSALVLHIVMDVLFMETSYLW